MKRMGEKMSRDIKAWERWEVEIELVLKFNVFVN